MVLTDREAIQYSDTELICQVKFKEYPESKQNYLTSRTVKLMQRHKQIYSRDTPSFIITNKIAKVSLDTYVVTVLYNIDVHRSAVVPRSQSKNDTEITSSTPKIGHKKLTKFFIFPLKTVLSIG